MTDDTRDPQAGPLRGYTGHWERLAEAGRQISHLDAQITLLRLRRTHAVRRHGRAIDMAVVVEATDLENKWIALEEGTSKEEEN